MLFPIHLSLLLAMFASSSSGVLGTWVAPDRSLVSVYPCGSGSNSSGQVCLRLIQIANVSAPAVDEKNSDASQRHRPLCGLEIGTGFHLLSPDRAEGGKLYDPKTGNTYSGVMVAEGDQLKLRGFIGISLFGRTETWQRAHDNPKPCAQ